MFYDKSSIFLENVKDILPKIQKILITSKKTRDLGYFFEVIDIQNFWTINYYSKNKSNFLN